MIELKNKQIMIDGKPQLIMCGQIHYFRLERKDWQDRIDKLKAAGCNAVAVYVPWLCHEPNEGQFDLEGKTIPQLDLGGFIDLCKENELYFIVRPGPFIMAEMKNQGLPYWLYPKHPEMIPVSWDNKQVRTATVDYLAPQFLQETRKWYAAVMAVIAPRLQTKGGNIIGIQLDNEMASNSPDLTDYVITDFVGWLKATYEVQSIQARYPFQLDDREAWRAGIRSPRDEYATFLMHDLGYYMRSRFARYVAILRAYAEEFGVSGVPFMVNIHGSHAGRALTFPIGISQLYESYTQEPGYVSGSDLYLGDLTISSFQDLYLVNSFMDAVNLPDQPLTSLEFSCGDGNYGNTYGGRLDPSAADLKTRMCVAQGNRILNYYTFAGGTNYRLDPKPDDGNDRIAGNGEHQGFAAPVGPTGKLNYTYPRMARSIKTMMAVSDKLAVMKEEKDGVAFAFIPDYYMTEYHYPNSEPMNKMVKNLEKNRAGAWEIMGRAMLLSGYRFGSIDVQNNPIDPNKTPVLALPSASYMHEAIQQKLVNYLHAGGGILLYGEIPSLDMGGNPCTILADALHTKPICIRHSAEKKYLSVYAEGWAKPRPEIRTGSAQACEFTGTEAILKIYGTDEVCGFDVSVGQGRAIAIAAAYCCDIPLFKAALEKLGAKAALNHDHPEQGIFMTSTASKAGERFIHLLNLDGFDKELCLYENGRALLDGRKMVLQSKDGVLIPLNVSFNDRKIVYSTAEIVNVIENAIQFRLTQSEDVIVFETNREIAPSRDYAIRKEGERTFVISRKHAKVDDSLAVIFNS